MMINPFDVVRDFETEMASFTGAPYAVAVDSCTSALFLSLMWNHNQIVRKQAEISTIRKLMPAIPVVQIPKHTFISVPTAAIRAGFSVVFVDNAWHGSYRLFPLPVYDAACELTPNMFLHTGVLKVGQAVSKSTTVAMLQNYDPPLRYVCLNFQHRKPLPIGRGGMILHNDPDADVWFRKQRFYGREECPLADDPGPTELGWRMYMEPEEASSGLRRLHQWDADNPGGRIVEITYQDLSEIPAFQKHIVQ